MRSFSALKLETNSPPPDEDYYSFDSTVPGIKIHEIWDYIRKHKTESFKRLEEEFAVKSFVIFSIINKMTIRPKALT